MSSQSFSNSVFSRDQTFQDAMNTVELHSSALNRYNVYFRDAPSTSSLVDQRFQILSQVMDKERDIVNGMYSHMSHIHNGQPANQGGRF